jgi:preprotein translocase SecE subunit
MALVTNGDERNKPMPGDDGPDEKQLARRDEADEEGDERQIEHRPSSAGASSQGGGFFSLYKPGQGYWTRLGTGVTAAVLVTLIGQFLYTNLATRTALDTTTGPHGELVYGFPYWKAGIVGAVVLPAAIVIWRILNKPTIVDFFIATESEMKKVNWTTRKDLIGSTKVVIFFMLLIAAVLFVMDIFFGYFFFIVRVLKHGPFE